MSQPFRKLLLVIPIASQDDLLPIVESEGWQTVRDLFRKTGTSYNTHWNGKYVLDQDEKPWKITGEELLSLRRAAGRVVVVTEGDYGISKEIPLYVDTDGSTYVLEDDIQLLL
ncbi:MAG: hypothetical protein V2B18_01080 [Pseudomonadota bacterium]